MYTNLINDPLIPGGLKNEGPRMSYSTVVSLTIVIALPSILEGMTQAYSAVALPQLYFSLEDSSWFAAAPGFASPIGLVLLVVVIDLCGRRAALMASVLPQTIGWMTIIYANRERSGNIFGRLVTGLSAGALFYPARVYAAETIAAHRRSSRFRNDFETRTETVSALGVLLTFALSCYFNYEIVSSFAAIFSVICLILVFAFVPESPAWLHLKGRIGDAEISERKLGIFQPLLRKCERKAAVGLATENINCSWSACRRCLGKLGRKDVYKPLLVTCLAEVLAQSSGGFAVLAYMVDVMGTDSAAPAPSLTSYGYCVKSGVLMLVARVLVRIAWPYCNLRTLTLFSCAGSSLGMIAIGFTFSQDGYSSNSNFVHVVAVWLVTFAYNFGVNSVPSIVTGSTIPSYAKAFTSIPVMASLVSGAVFVKLHPYLQMQYGGCLYYGYAGGGILYAIFACFFIPDAITRTNTDEDTVSEFVC